MFRTLATLFTLTLGSAGAGCVITQAQVDLPTYSALRATTGTLAVRIDCDSAQDSASLLLEGPGLSRAPDQTLRLTLYRTTAVQQLHDAAPIQITVGQGLSLIDGLNITGSQTLRFALTAQAGQWGPVGAYTLPLTLSLRPSLP